jgi:ubiquinone/menaquinone biosynthesis C-methylase UbiE
VLDIGCGSGIVGRSLVRAQPSLQVVGVDAAQVRAPLAASNVRILSGIKIETLPFVDRCCGAAVSQFGYEYSDIYSAAVELERVLKPGGPFSFVVHHSQSPIVRGDLLHNKALRAATGNGVKLPFLSGDSANVSSELAKLQRQFPEETTLWLLARGLLEQIAGTLEQRQRLWNSVKRALAPDRTLSDALEASCVSPDEIEAWLTPLRQAFDVDRPSILHIQGEPLAWKIEGRRKMR